MTTHTDQLDLPYSPRQVFDLVADIESYPLFLPHIASAHIRERRGNEWDVDQVVRLKMLRLAFSTHALLEPPKHIRIVCNDSNLASFTEDWAFAEGPNGGTRLSCTTQFHTRSGLLNRIVDIAFADVHRTTMHAFAARARVLYRIASKR
jgi:coenzyme Q-binding protein COQ10